MPLPNPPSQLEDPRVYLAVERTFLAWIRTGLALMGFGFVVARFGLFLHELSAMQPDTMPPARGVSGQFGTALVLLGAALTGVSVPRYFLLLKRLDAGGQLRRPSRLAVVTAVLLSALGFLVSLYLMVTVAWPLSQ